jgi:5'(3')-deoxyribonucleotidase
MGIRKYNGPRIYLDMDGVVADFSKAVTKSGLSHAEYKLLRYAFADLDPMEGAKEGIAKIMDLGFEVFICTKIPSGNPLAATEKVEWINKHFPHLGDRIIITPDKGCVGRGCDVLVDDHPEWANAHNFPGAIIRFGNPSSLGCELVTSFYASNWSELPAMIFKIMVKQDVA